MRLPTWDELSSDEEQIEVLEAPLDKSLYVVGPPGSGKTSLAIWRGGALSELYGVIPIVTYNRMLRRSLQLAANEFGLRINASTMQSFVWRDYSNRAGQSPPRIESDPYAYDWNVMNECLIDSESGHDALVVDEGQDLPEQFFAYAKRCTAKSMTVFADEEQAISVSGSTLEKIQRAAGLSDPIILSENHRNTPEIAKLAEHFHRGRLPTATVIRLGSGIVPRLVRSKGVDSTIRRIINELRNRGSSIGVIVDQECTCEALYDALKDRLRDWRVDMYSHKLRNEDSIDVRTPGVTVLNKESVKGQEFETVFILELDRFIPCTTDVHYRAMYMMCSRACDNLFLVYGPGPLSKEADAALPSREILIR